MGTSPPTPGHLVDTFNRVTAALPDGVTRKKMFGYPSVVINGNMFAGTHGTSIVLRLDDLDRTAFEAEHGPSPFEPMPGRPMKNFIAIADELGLDDVTLTEWVERAFHHAAALPPK